MSYEIIGWLASAVLLTTLSHQVYNQWASGTSKGVSLWLFIGQLAASAGFTAYAVLVGNTVFIVTNVLIGVSGLVGLLVLLRHRRSGREEGPDAVSGHGAIHHIGLATDRWEEAIAFYTGVLGAREALHFDEHGARVVMLDLAGGCRIELFETKRARSGDDGGSPPDAAAGGSDAPPGALVHFGIAVDDAAEATRRAAALGVLVEEPVERMRLSKDTRPGRGPSVTYSFIRGPGGELIELIEGYKD
jgi:catechol 2,3-dioxygenase-like lactoylglutathione lyase family enzyme/uncharacterized protein with PQ loop repeat